MEKFYEELEKAIDKKSCRYHIEIGDFNAKSDVRSTRDNAKGLFGIVTKTNKQTDSIMYSDIKITGNCEVMTKVDIGSEDRTVRTKVEINKEINKGNPETKTPQIRP